ncbi:hypothetical protein FACS189479_04420 [Spirochaetia bacterium]|nr:hypothetical protein FACS189479_04420 [Spirochaetia bacterium]
MALPQNAISLYETETLLPLLNEQFAPTTFFRDNFFRNSIPITTGKIQLDLIKGTRRILPYSRPINKATQIEFGGWDTWSGEIPYIKAKFAEEPDKYENRMPGQNPYAAASPAVQAAQWRAEKSQEVLDMLTRTEEVQCAQGLTTGIVTLKNENNTQIQQVNFGLPADHNIIESVLWTNTTAFNAVIDQLRAYKAKISHDSGIQPTDVVVPPNVATILRHVFSPDKADNAGSALAGTGSAAIIWAPRIEIADRPPAEHVSYFCTIPSLNLDVYEYSGIYQDYDGTEKPFIPAGKIVMLSRYARFDRYYGVIKNWRAGLVALPRFPFEWEEPDGSARYFQIESAPLFAPHQVDSFIVSQVAAAA